MISRAILPFPGEVWKDILWTDGIYQVSNLGRVRSAKARRDAPYCSILKQRLNNPYPIIRFKYRAKEAEKRVHRLVAEAFLGPCPKGLVVNHKDGNKFNNKLENLEYVSQKENNRHSYSLRFGAFVRDKKKRCSSHFVGVSWKKANNSWCASISLDGKRTHLGYFKNEIDAGRRYFGARVLRGLDEAMRKRYTHLIPSTASSALASVFS